MVAGKWFGNIGKGTIIFIIILMLGMKNCGNNKPDYTGEYPELYSVAVHSLLGTNGFEASEVRFSPRIRIVEEDQYGKKLFLYSEDNFVSTYGLIISQKSDDEYVYFYPDDNFISVAEGEYVNYNLDWTSEEDIPREEIKELKRQNDWNKEVDIDRCTKVKIVRKKEKGPVKNQILEELYHKALGEDAYDYKAYTYFLVSDDYGRSIYLGRGMYFSNRYVVMLFQPDGSYDESKCLMELKDLQKYQDELKQFKELNGWNQPPSIDMDTLY